MDERYGSLTSSIEGCTFSNIKNFLSNISFDNQVDLHILNEKKEYFRHVIHFKIEGFESNINSFKASMLEAIEAHEEKTFYADKWNVKQVSLTESLEKQHLSIDLITHRFSSIEQLAEKIQKHFDIPFSINSEKSIFNKKIHIDIYADHQKLKKFKKIFMSHVVSQYPINCQLTTSEATKLSKYKF